MFLLCSKEIIFLQAVGVANEENVRGKHFLSIDSPVHMGRPCTERRGTMLILP
jgi:hypothetical protein